MGVAGWGNWLLFDPEDRRYRAATIEETKSGTSEDAE